jgi:hypothetical protein
MPNSRLNSATSAVSMVRIVFICLRSPVGMQLNGGAYFLYVLPGPPTSSRASSNIRFNNLEEILQTRGADGPGDNSRIFAQQRKPYEPGLPGEGRHCSS